MEEKENYRKTLIIKILILIILILLIVITSFRSGEKFYLLKNTYFGDTKANVGSDVARWNFNARVKYGNEVIYFENN